MDEAQRSFILMLEPMRLYGWKPLVAALYALATLTLGFAHAPLRSPGASRTESTAVQSEAVLQSDAAPPICGAAKSGAPKSHPGDVSCDACRLTAAPGALPPPPTLADAPRAIKLPPARALASVADTAALEPQSRDPPALS